MTKPTAVHIGRKQSEPHWVDLVYEGEKWRFDATFLLSTWRCIYGAGCCGITGDQDPVRADGCCAVGAQLTEADDFATVAQSVSRLTPDLWQHQRQSVGSAKKPKTWFKRLPDGTVATRVVDGGCIFLNRPGFETGPGCAFHFASQQDDSSHVDWKPNVCWQLPLRRERVNDMHVVRAWAAADFGQSGAALRWWCTDQASEPTAFTDDTPVWRSLHRELLAMLGDELYDLLTLELQRVSA
jgi:hypothetical protein